MQLIDKDDAEYYEEHGITAYDGELGKVLVTDPLVPEDKDGTIYLDLKSFFGMHTLLAEGTRPLPV